MGKQMLRKKLKTEKRNNKRAENKLKQTRGTKITDRELC